MYTAEPINIVIADDHSFFRYGFTSIIKSLYPHDICFLADVSNGLELLQAVATHQPDIVITDIQMPEMNGTDACRTITEKYPSVSVIALSMFTDINTIIGMVQAGAKGYLSKSSDHKEIFEAIKTVSRQQSYYCSAVAGKIFGELSNSSHRKNKEKKPAFGQQEKRVMQLICRQLSTKEIASQMSLAPKTIEHYRQNIQEKIGARNVVGIALYALVNEIVRYSEIALSISQEFYTAELHSPGRHLRLNH